VKTCISPANAPVERFAQKRSPYFISDKTLSQE
jgi:hypothetical protein